MQENRLAARRTLVCRQLPSFLAFGRVGRPPASSPDTDWRLSGPLSGRDLKSVPGANLKLAQSGGTWPRTLAIRLEGRPTLQRSRCAFVWHRPAVKPRRGGGQSRVCTRGRTPPAMHSRAHSPRLRSASCSRRPGLACQSAMCHVSPNFADQVHAKTQSPGMRSAAEVKTANLVVRTWTGPGKHAA